MNSIGWSGGLRNSTSWFLARNWPTSLGATAMYQSNLFSAAYFLRIVESSLGSMSRLIRTRLLALVPSMAGSCWTWLISPWQVGHQVAMVSTRMTLPLKSLILNDLPVFTSVICTSNHEGTVGAATTGIGSTNSVGEAVGEAA